MDQVTSPKKYPITTSEVAKMLGINNVSSSLPMGTFTPADKPAAPAHLPIADDHTTDSTHSIPSVNATHTDEAATATAIAPTNKVLKIAKAIAPFAAVFIVGLFLYYFFFSATNFSALLPNSSPKADTPAASALQQLEAQDLTAYQQWVKGFYYDVHDPKILDPDVDNSGNGLTNFEKYLLNLNPKSYDTLGLGAADSQDISNGIDPVTGGALTPAQKAVIAKYVDMEGVMNRLALNNLQNPSRVAGASINSSGTAVYTDTSPSQGLNIRGSSNQAVVSNAAPTVNSSDLDINTNVPGKLEIPDLKITVPIIWSSSSNNFDEDLRSGVVHYPGTAMPGQIGTTYIAGHSSNYIWAKGSYNEVFSTLGKLGNNASFKITVTLNNGQQTTLNYVVTSEKQYTPTDPGQFENSGKSIVALSTCWPVGSTAKRLVVFGELVK